MPSIAKSPRASLTSSSLNGLMIASTFFIGAKESCFQFWAAWGDALGFAANAEERERTTMHLNAVEARCISSGDTSEFRSAAAGGARFEAAGFVVTPATEQAHPATIGLMFLEVLALPNRAARDPRAARERFRWVQ